MAGAGPSKCSRSNIPVKVSLLGVPRSLSTVFMKCLSAIPGIDVFMELYNYALVGARLYEKETGKRLPAVLQGHEAEYEQAVALSEEAYGIVVPPKSLSFASIKEKLETSVSRYILIKEQVFLLDNNCLPYLPTGFKHTFLIREPSRVFASFRRGVVSHMGQRLYPSDPESIDIIRDDVYHNEPLAWYENQHKLWKYVQQHDDRDSVVIIDASDLVSQPGAILKAYCQAVGLPYSDDLLQWEATGDFPDNVATATMGEQLREDFADFYSVALKSTHFVAPTDPGPIPRDQLADDVIRCVDRAMPFYQDMYEHRLQF